MARLEFFFDCSSPWTYLAFTRIQEVIARTEAEIVWKPILVGGVFNAVNQAVYQRRANPEPRQRDYYNKDMQDWARLADIRILWPPSVFPVKSTMAMRGAFLAIERGQLLPYAREVFRAYFGDDQDIAKPEILGAAAARAGLDPAELLAYADSETARGLLRATTDELITRGGFGSPTMFVNGTDMYFGNDRLPLVEAALKASA
jgi:2-hydroxychromene-2-carboxylate isomerase